jgi:hypothetical protein
VKEKKWDLQYIAGEISYVASFEASRRGTKVILIMDDKQALFPINLTLSNSRIARENLQQSETKHKSKAKLLFCRHLEMPNQVDGENICEDIGCDVARRIRKVESIDVYALLVGDGEIPCGAHRRALEEAS